MAAPDTARACSCIGAPTEPANGATNVPLNTRLWTHDPSPGLPLQYLELRVKGGADVPLATAGALQFASGARMAVLTPAHLLAPRTTYELASFTGAVISTFTTGDTPDSVPPAAPAGRPVRACARLTPNSSCGNSHQSVELDITTDEVALVVLTRGETPPPPSLDRYPPSWPPQPNPVSFHRVRNLDPYGLGLGGCTVWPHPEPRGTVFYGALDIAGNFSGWTRGGDLGLPDLPSAPPDASAVRCVEYGDGGVSLDASPDVAGPRDAPGLRDAAADVVAPSADATAMDATPIDSRTGGGVDGGDAGTGPGRNGGGCSCSLPGRSPVGSGALAVLLVGAGAAVGARRRTRPYS